MKNLKSMPRRDSNPQSQLASCRRHTPYTARPPLGLTYVINGGNFNCAIISLTRSDDNYLQPFERTRAFFITRTSVTCPSLYNTRRLSRDVPKGHGHLGCLHEQADTGGKGGRGRHCAKSISPAKKCSGIPLPQYRNDQ